MLTLTGDTETTGGAQHLHGSLTRRGFIEVGTLGFAGLSLPAVLRARDEARANGASPRPTSIIFLELAGGPTQFETYDPKPDAPSEIRGPFGVVETSVPGVRFCELMAEQAKVMDKLAIVRSIHHPSSSHDPSSHLTQTGYYKRGRGGNEFPCIGSVAARIRGPNEPGMPPYVTVPSIMRNGGAAYLGNAFDPFQVGNNPNKDGFHVKNLKLVGGLTPKRVTRRQDLAEQLDSLRRIADTHATASAMDRFTREAFDLVTGEKAYRAFNLEAEDDRVRDLYGRTRAGQGMLLARRLVEAGVTFVSVRVPGWDDHSKIAKQMRSKGPAYDRGVAALVTDLHARGLDRDVLVVAMGEFGRTPRINRNAGRDHWGALMSVLFAGGGLRVGQVVGASNASGEVPIDAPYRPENVLAMLYRHLNIDPATTFEDFTGRPRYLLERRAVIRELL